MAKSSKSSKSKSAKASKSSKVSKTSKKIKATAAKKTTKKTTTKKKVVKKTVAKKTTPKKKTTSKAAKPTAKKSTAKKTTSKKKISKKTVAKKAPAKKVAKKTSAKKTSVKKAPAKKTTAKQAPVKTAKTTKKTSRKAPAKPVKKAPGISETLPSLARGRASASPMNNGAMNGSMSLEELSESKLKRAKSGLKKKDLDFFRAELLERRSEIVGDVANLDAARNNFGGEISNVPLHMADVGSENYDREFNLGLLEHERKQLREIGDALMRIENGTYGVCHVTGQPIERIRLEIQPWAKYCIAVVRERERRGLST